MLDQVEQRLLGPVDVVEDEHHRTIGGEPLDEPPCSPEDVGHRERGRGEADCRGDALGDLALHHHHHSLGWRCRLEKVAQDRRCDLVRQIRDHFVVGRAAEQRGRIDAQHIVSYDLELGHAQLLLEPVRETSVELDRPNFAGVPD